MKRPRSWMKWTSALVASVAAAACGITVSEPIVTDEAASAVSPVTPSKLVKDLSLEDADAWCSWYVLHAYQLAEMNPVPVSAKVLDDGFTCRGANNSTFCGHEPNHVCMVQSSIEQCVQNLQRQPCEAPVAELDACVLSAARLDGSCDSYCPAFLAHANCSGTVVQRTQDLPPAGRCDPAAQDDTWYDKYDCRIPID
jgi:hypothetical protein